ncbi:MAG: hypothetical protein ACOC7U_04155 [Spirochaetota bacterium]
MVAAQSSRPPADGLSKDQIKQMTDEVITRIERKEEQKLLARIREQGLGGFDQLLLDLQEGRLHLLAVPWNLKILSEQGAPAYKPSCISSILPFLFEPDRKCNFCFFNTLTISEAA